MSISVSPELERISPPSQEDHLLDGKYIIIVMVGMRHRDMIYKRAHELGAKMIFLDKSIPDWAKPYAYDFIPCDNASVSYLVIEAIEKYVKTQHLNDPKWDIDGIVTLDDWAVVAASHAAKHFNKIGMSPETIMRAKNKYNFRSECRAAGFYVPVNFSICPLKLANHEYDDIIQNIKFPCVLKPTAGASSCYVRQIHNQDELYHYVSQYYHDSKNNGFLEIWKTKQSTLHDDITDDEDPFMLEEMMLGHEVDIDIIVQDGNLKYIAISDNFPTKSNEGLFLEAGGALPSILPQCEQDLLKNATEQMIKHFKNELSGVFHFEAMLIKHPETGLLIAAPLELNLRPGGSEVSVFNLAVYNNNIGLQSLKIACGIDIPYSIMKPLKQCVSTNILAAASGYIRNVGFHNSILTSSSYQGGMHRCYIGQALKAPPLGFQFLGWAVASGDTLDDAKKALREIELSFYCDIEPYPYNDPNGMIISPNNDDETNNENNIKHDNSTYYLSNDPLAPYISLIKQRGDVIDNIVLKNGVILQSDEIDKYRKSLQFLSKDEIAKCINTLKIK